MGGWGVSTCVWISVTILPLTSCKNKLTDPDDGTDDDEGTVWVCAHITRLSPLTVTPAHGSLRGPRAHIHHIPRYHYCSLGS
jgi:hypothetical protein